DEVHLDEIQSMLKINVPIILACTEASSYARKVFTGTPLSETNQIEEYWKRSTQTEWVVPCNAHTPPKWNILDIDSIGKNGIICKSCGRSIDPRNGRWVDMVSPDKADMKGFHVNQLGMVKKQQPADWAELLVKMETWREDQFYNEVLGESVGQANRPITQKMLVDCSGENQRSRTQGWDGTQLYDKPPTSKTIYFAGVDWGEGRELASMDGGKKRYASFTHFVIGAYDIEGRFRPVHWKKFQGKQTDPEFIIPYIVKMTKRFNCHMLGSDFGFGWGMNSRLMAALGKNKVIPLLHSGNLKELYRWDADGWKMVLNRNAFISRLINSIKFNHVAFPDWDTWAEYAADFMAIYGEYNHMSNKIRYDHSVQEPDDGLHAFLYAKFVADKSLGRVPNDTE
ncbi:MAG: phage terminase large subunit family protein, partial [Sedimenticola sp.]|nr:phage terminase large subunit family protein [Sedimenticola sp.]